MNIKKILLPLIVIMSGYSFSAYSEIREVYQGSSSPSTVAACGFPIGTKYSVSKTKACTGSKSGYTWTWFSATAGSIDVGWRNNLTGKTGSARSISRRSTCNAPSEINPETGICESPPPAPPFCQSPQVNELREENKMSCAVQGGTYSEECNNETESYVPKCDVPPPPIDEFCDSAEVSAMKSEGLKSCTAQGGSYSFECNNQTEAFTDTCSNIPPEPPEPPPECVPSQDNNWCDNPPCKIGYAGWPECEPWYNDDPTAPIDPVVPPTPDPIDPVPPRPVDPVNPQPPLQPGDPFNDSRVVGAIQNLNKDMNFGFSDINGALQLQTNILSNNNDLIVHGLQQDLEIYENNKKLLINNTESIVNAIGSIPSDAPFDDTDIIDAINGISTGKGYDDSMVVAHLQMINSKMPEQCVPSEENNQCENPHGLNEEYISTMFGQLNDKLDSELSAADSSLLGAASDLVTKPPVDESTVKPFLDLSTSILTGNDKCVAIDWFGYELGCEFSDKFKQIFGFLLYMWTLKVLIDILLEDITPNQKSYTHRRR